jgi:nicotinamidase-related amidase
MPDPIAPGHAALLAMDFQNGIVGSIADADPLLSRVAGVIALVRERGGHVGYVRVAFTDADFERFPPHSAMGRMITPERRAAMHADAPGTAIDERIAPRDEDIVVRKTRVGAFSTTDLADQLRSRDVTTLILTGIATSGVVLSTVRDAADRDFRIVVLEDGCADRDPEVHAVLTGKVFPRQAEVLGCAELDGLLGAA